MTVIIKRVWAMPNPATFTIPPIKSLLNRYVGDGKGWIDPFAGNNSPAEFTNDLNPKTKATYHLEANEFCKRFAKFSMIGAIFDPPYSLRQAKECYDGFGSNYHLISPTNQFYSKIKDTLSLLVKPGGYAICCGWNSQGFGKKRGFQLIEILLVCHGRGHNDTIVTVERRMNNIL